MEEIEILRANLELLEDNFKDFRKEAEQRITRLERSAKKVMVSRLDDVSKANTIFLKHKYESFSAINQISETRYRLTVYGTAAKRLKHAASRTKDNMVSYVVLGREIILKTSGDNKKRYRSSAEAMNIDIHAKLDFTSMYCPVDCEPYLDDFIVRIDLSARINPNTLEVMLL